MSTILLSKCLGQTCPCQSIQRDVTHILRIFLVLILLPIFLVFAAASANAQYKLYGVVSQPPNAGWLVEIDPSTGAATLIGNTGMTMPAGLTCDLSSGTIYASDGFGGGPIHTVNPLTGAATAVGGATGAVGCLAFRVADGFLYSVLPGVSTSVLYQISPATGAIVNTIGVINKGTMGGLAERQSDGVLFGGGSVLSGGIQEWLFTVSTVAGPPPRETDVGMTGQMITGLTFHPTTNVLYATNSSQLYTVNPSTGAMTLVGSHSTGGTTVGFVAGLTFAPDPSASGVDVWIKDCSLDDGTVPSNPGNCPQWWTSTDIWIDNNNDNIIDSPVVGATNILKALVRNRGVNSANGVDVKFYYRDNSTGLMFPDGATLIGQTNVSIGPGGAVVAQVPWNIPAPPATGGHWCIGVVLDHTSDSPISPVVSPPLDNNVGIANLWFIAGRAGDTVSLSFGAGTGGKSGFGFDQWPRDFMLQVNDHLPTGWIWHLEGALADEPFTLTLGEERKIDLFIDVAEDAPPHSGGSVEVRQIDVQTGRNVGGVQFNLYEDHLPPIAPAALSTRVIDGQVELTWPEVAQETESGLRERIAYYLIIRDGRPLAKATIDAAAMPGFQWIDTTAPSGAVKYQVTAVDEGGNESEASGAVTVNVPQTEVSGPFSSFCLTVIVLLLLTILILGILSMRRR